MSSIHSTPSSSSSSLIDWVRLSSVDVRKHQKRLGVVVDKLAASGVDASAHEALASALQHVAAHVDEATFRGAVADNDLAFFLNHALICLVAAGHAAATFGFAVAVAIAERLQSTSWLSQPPRGIATLYEALDLAIAFATDGTELTKSLLRKRVPTNGGTVTTVSATLQLDHSSKIVALQASVTALQHEADARRFVLQQQSSQR